MQIHHKNLCQYINHRAFYLEWWKANFKLVEGKTNEYIWSYYWKMFIRSSCIWGSNYVFNKFGNTSQYIFPSLPCFPLECFHSLAQCHLLVGKTVSPPGLYATYSLCSQDRGRSLPEAKLTSSRRPLIVLTGKQVWLMNRTPSFITLNLKGRVPKTKGCKEKWVTSLWQWLTFQVEFE